MPHNRPLSPHLQIYRWQLHMVMSIVHRITGLGLGVGGVLLAWWAVALAAGEAAFGAFQAFIVHPAGRLVLFGFTFSLIYHALNGIRHLFWDIGWGFEKKTASRSGLLVLFLAVAATAALWAFGYMQAGKL